MSSFLHKIQTNKQNQNSKKVLFTRGFQDSHQSLPSKYRFPRFLRVKKKKNFSKDISQLFWCIRSFQSIICSYFGPKATPFLRSSSSCRKPTKCKLATPGVIRCRPGKDFARAIQIARATRFPDNVKMKNKQTNTKFLLLLHEYKTNDYTHCSLEGIKLYKIKYEGKNEQTKARQTDRPNQRRKESTKHRISVLFPDLFVQTSKMVDGVIPI